MSNVTDKAVRTRRNRDRFAQVYGPTTSSVVRAIARGLTSDQVSEKTGVTLETVAAYRANVTRGTYAPYVRGSLSRGFTGTCNF